jgi:hypothetical protein
MTDTYIGYPWSTSAALKFLGGLGYIADPRLALRIIQSLEQRHIVDRRRIEQRRQPRIIFPRTGQCPKLRRAGKLMAV